MEILQDRFWRETAEQVLRLGVAPDLVIAPPGFEQLIPGITTYKYLNAFESAVPDVSASVVVLHKGQLDEVGIERVEFWMSSLTPIYANEVFVVFSELGNDMTVTKSRHFLALKKAMSDRFRTGSPHSAAPPAIRPLVYMGERVALTRSIYGHKLYVNTRDYSLAPHILLDGYWENWITNVFRKVVRPGMKVLDIGSNIGWYSVLAADLIGSTGRLTSFEANPEIAELAYRNIMINGYLDRATVVNKAVFSTSTDLEFHLYDRYMGSSSLFASEAAAKSYHDELRTITVQAVALDDYFQPGSQVDFIKMDAEGAEPHILKGSDRLLRDNPQVQIMMEFAPSVLSVSWGGAEKFCAEILQLGFEIWRIEHNSTMQKVSIEELLNTPHCDVVLKR